MIVTKTPFRVSFFCGGSDMPAFYEREQGAAFSVTVDKFVYVCIHETASPSIRVMFDTVQELDDLSLIDHRITKAALEYASIRKGITVTSISDITRRGSGLGSSSAFTVGLLLGLMHTKSDFGYRCLDIISDNHALAELACHIEIDRSGYHIGKQDQYAAVYGGTNLFTFERDGTVVNHPHNIPQTVLDELQTRLLLVYTGRMRQASDMLMRQTSAITNNADKFDLARENKNRAFEAVQLLQNADLDGFGYLLHDSWMAKKAIVSSMTQPDIDAIYNTAIRAGAEGGKLLGAGGGGFFVFYVHPSRRQALKDAILLDPLCQVYDCNIHPTGSELLVKD